MSSSSSTTKILLGLAPVLVDPNAGRSARRRPLISDGVTIGWSSNRWESVSRVRCSARISSHAHLAGAPSVDRAGTGQGMPRPVWALLSIQHHQHPLLSLPRDV